MKLHVSVLDTRGCRAPTTTVLLLCVLQGFHYLLGVIVLYTYRGMSQFGGLTYVMSNPSYASHLALVPNHRKQTQYVCTNLRLRQHGHLRRELLEPSFVVQLNTT